MKNAPRQFSSPSPDSRFPGHDSPPPALSPISAHEFECTLCRYTIHVEVGPRPGGHAICTDCRGPIKYNGLVPGISPLTLGVKQAK